MRQVPMSDVIEWLALALAPGLIATTYWWRSRAKPK
jgi:hypothetical protein